MQSAIQPTPSPRLPNWQSFRSPVSGSDRPRGVYIVRRDEPTPVARPTVLAPVSPLALWQRGIEPEGHVPGHMRFSEAARMLGRVGKWLGYGEIQLDGLNRLRNSDGDLWLPDASVWLFTHQDKTDMLLLARILRQIPAVQGPQRLRKAAPHIIMRSGNERWVTDAIAPEYFTYVETATHQKNEAPEARSARQARNAEVLNSATEGLLRKGVQLVVLPEGTLQGDGSIRVDKSGAIMAARACDGVPVPFVPCTITFDPLAHQPTKVFVTVGDPMTLQEFTTDRQALGHAAEDAVQRQMALLNTVTVTGVVGAYLLTHRNDPGFVVTEDKLQSLLATAVELSLRDPSLRMDYDLQNPLRLRELVAAAYQQILRRGYVDRSTQVLNTNVLGEPADLDVPAAPAHARPRRVSQNDPLRFWGNRMLQHAHYSPAAHAMLTAAAAAGDAAAPPPAFVGVARVPEVPVTR